jgi:hypothetical protein
MGGSAAGMGRQPRKADPESFGSKSLRSQEWVPSLGGKHAEYLVGFLRVRN